MKALTISQPYASLIVSGEKWVENRTWATQYRGTLAIHAGKGKQYLTREEMRDYPIGCVIGFVDLVGCVPLEWAEQFAGYSASQATYGGRTLEEIVSHKHAEGPYCWILANPIALPEPLPTRGSLGLWDWEPGYSLEDHIHDMQR